MKTRVMTVLVAASLSLPLAAFSEDTNETLDLFGITVTDKVPEAEKQFGLGSAYFSGDGVEQDLAKAIECFKKAAELGHAQAQFNLGICYMQGNGVEASDETAATWFKKAAEQNMVEALYPLGICYYNLEQYTEAYAWALLAESKGDTRLKAMFDTMFTEEESADGQARFKELTATQEKPKTEVDTKTEE